MAVSGADSDTPTTARDSSPTSRVPGRCSAQASAEAAARLPLLDPDRIRGAYWVPTDGIAKPVWAAAEMLRRAGDAVALVCGSTRAVNELGWEPKRSTLRQMIGDAFAWSQKPGYER